VASAQERTTRKQLRGASSDPPRDRHGTTGGGYGRPTNRPLLAIACPSRRGRAVLIGQDIPAPIARGCLNRLELSEDGGTLSPVRLRGN
jgi:hypothetical protein